jgi:hypothetical protein
MRCAIGLVCLFGLPCVAQAQYPLGHVPPADPYSRGPYVVGRLHYRYGGDVVQAWPRAATGSYYSTNLGLGYQAAPSPPRPRYFYYPNYPGFNYSPPAPVRPSLYSQPPPLRTPLHDPFFEEHFWDAVGSGGDLYEYWGW